MTIAENSLKTLFKECIIQNLSIDCERVGMMSNNIKIMFENCNIKYLSIYNYSHFIIESTFANGLTIEQIYLNNTNTADFVNKFKIDAQYINKIIVF